jgi:hypothetical protein
MEHNCQLAGYYWIPGKESWTTAGIMGRAKIVSFRIHLPDKPRGFVKRLNQNKKKHPHFSIISNQHGRRWNESLEVPPRAWLWNTVPEVSVTQP